MATLTPVIVPAKSLSDGRHKLRISVSHNSGVRYIVTDIILDDAKQLRSGQIVRRPDAAYLNTKLRALMQQYQRRLDEIESKESLTCAELVALIKEGHARSRRTLASILDEYRETRRISDGTYRSMGIAVRAVSACLGDDFAVSGLTHMHVLRIDRHLVKTRGMKANTVRYIMTVIKSLVHYAERCGYAEFRTDPFANYKMPKTQVSESWLTPQEIVAIRDFKTKSEACALARDIFMLSYYLGGINVADLKDIVFADGMRKLRYTRKKTEGRSESVVEFAIPQEAREILKRRVGADGKISLLPGHYKSNCHSLWDCHLPKIAKALGIRRLVYYSARKSFAQHAYSLGVSANTIDYILGHSVNTRGSCLYFYVKVTPQMATDAVRKVLDALK